MKFGAIFPFTMVVSVAPVSKPPSVNRAGPCNAVPVVVVTSTTGKASAKAPNTAGPAKIVPATAVVPSTRSSVSVNGVSIQAGGKGAGFGGILNGRENIG